MWNTLVKFINENKHNADEQKNVDYARMLLGQLNTAAGSRMENEIQNFIDNGFKLRN